MAVHPASSPQHVADTRLVKFDPAYADYVVRWVHGAREAFWLAPRTRPPLTAEKICAWQRDGRRPLMLIGPDRTIPLAYGELNILRRQRGEYWLGHLIVDPDLRGQKLGLRLTQLLLRRAFELHGATSVSLVVFPDNPAAIACYRSAGMRDVGSEYHFFPPYERRERLLRFVITRPQYKAQGGPD